MDERLLTSNGIFAEHDVIDITEYCRQNGRKETEITMCQTNQSPQSPETGQVRQGPIYMYSQNNMPIILLSLCTNKYRNFSGRIINRV